MKKVNHSISFLLILMMFIPNVKAQNKYPIGGSIFNILSIEDLQDDGSFKLILQTQPAGEELSFKKIAIKKNLSNYYNEFHTINYDATGTITSKTVKSVSPKGGKITLDLLDKAQDIETISIREDAVESPARYNSQSECTADIHISKLTIKEYSLDSLALINILSNTESRNIEHPESDSRNFMTPNQYIISPVGNNNTTVLYPVKLKEDASSYLKNFDFVTYNTKFEVQNVFNVAFNMPREIRYDLDVFDANNPKNKIGKLVVFRKKGKSGKKSPEPFKNLYEIVYFDNSGKLILHKTTKLGTTAKRRVKVEAALGTSNSINLFLKTNINNIDNVGVISYDSEENETSKFITEADLKSKISIIEDISKIPEIEDRAKAGAYNEALGYSAGINSEFKCIGIAPTENGDLLVYGQRMFEITSTTKNAAGNPVSTITEKYAEFLCFQYSSDFTLKKLYVSNLPMTGTLAAIKPIVNESGNVIFSIPVSQKKHKWRSKVLASTKDNFIELPYYNYDYTIKLLQINPETMDAKVIDHSNSISANEEKGIFVDSKNRIIHVFYLDIIEGEGQFLINSSVSY